MTHIVYTNTLCACGKALAYQDGLCIGCYSLKTARAIIDAQTPGGTCINCGRTNIHALKRCDACYEYHRRHGVDRKVTTVSKHKVCKNCGHPKLRARGRCMSCADYYQRTGRERPQRLIEMHKARTINRAIGTCITCGMPAATDRPECTACRMYRSKRGVTRPERLW